MTNDRTDRTDRPTDLDWPPGFGGSIVDWPDREPGYTPPDAQVETEITASPTAELIDVA